MNLKHTRSEQSNVDLPPLGQPPLEQSPLEQTTTEQAPLEQISVPLQPPSVPRPSSKKKEVKARHVTFVHQAWYQLCRFSIWLIIKIFFRASYRGCRNIPGKGAVLVVANHQSFLDPPAVGVGVYRRMNYLARKTLFRFKPFGWLMDSVDAIPLDQEGIGFLGIKETLRRLKNNEMVLIFPEGARCYDGEIQPFKAGYVLLAVRSKATIVPTAVSGTFNAWPRGQKIPWFFWYPIKVEYGTPITYEEYSSLSEKELHEQVEKSIRVIYDRLQAKNKKE